MDSYNNVWTVATVYSGDKMDWQKLKFKQCALSYHCTVSEKY